MKPGEVLTEVEGDVAGEMECEMQARDFFIHVGMLIVEGRTPQQSDKGRVEGPHCLSLISVVPYHVCNPHVNYLCQKVCERKQKMAVLWENSSPMVITVLMQSPDDSNWILLERWTIEAVDGIDDVQGCSGNMLLQALRSHIHFSQLSAWLSRSKGSIPSQVVYRISDIGDEVASGEFLKEPDFHTFPLANLHSNRALRVSVHSLPRCDIYNFADEILASKINELDAGQNCKCNENEDSLECIDNPVRSPLKKKSCRKQCDPYHDVKILNGNNCILNKQSILDFSKPSTSKSLVDQVVAMKCDDQNCLNTSKTSKDSLRSGYLTIRSLSDGSSISSLPEQMKAQQCEKENPSTTASIGCNKQKSSSECEKFDVQVNRSHSSPKISNPGGYRQALQSQRVGPGTIPIFNSKTGLPVSSSPAPLRRSATDLNFGDDCRETPNGIQEKSNNVDLMSKLSQSAPASTTQRLLGNFEESVLNGRMEAVGTVEGFTAELGASGSFCPAHVTLPVKAHFFSLSEDDAPSPYLGYMSLDDPSISRKGYHVPTKGTVQLTLFNPNKTVVKMFVVLYDFSDMPPRAQTFLRQKTFSVWKRARHSDEGQVSLHYLIHLRFVSSKSGRLYLHTDIKVIFARQPPDLPSGVTFCTVTDGPTEPRYTL